MKEVAMSLQAKIIIIVAVVLIVGFIVFGLVSFMPIPMKIKWEKVKKIDSNVKLLAPGEGGNTTDAQALVKLNENGTIDDSPWKILQFSDMHLSHELETTNNTIDHFIDALNREKPDFVAITGDIITRKGGRPRAKQLAEIFEKMGIYWGYVLGNHEGDSNPFTVSRKECVKILSSYPHCLTQADVKKTSTGEKVWGNGNFVVNLLGADYKLSQSLIFMDSGNKISSADAKKLGVAGGTYDYLKDSQKTWYKEQVEKAIAANSKTMLFIHIPLVEQGYAKFLKVGTPKEDGWYFAAGSELSVNGALVGSMVVKDGWNLIGGTASYEKCYCSDYNNGMYDLMKSLRAGVNALFCGHDHINSTVLYENYNEATEKPLFLCYATCSGIQGYNLYKYGLSDKDNYIMRGYNVISVNADKSFDLSSVLYDVEYAMIPRVLASEPVVR
ncbi:MAG: metallophosphoesterase [Clostridia bacterium]|nr:metallophosphoesterase [Clostridia bacterium]